MQKLSKSQKHKNYRWQLKRHIIKCLDIQQGINHNSYTPPKELEHTQAVPNEIGVFDWKEVQLLETPFYFRYGI